MKVTEQGSKYRNPRGYAYIAFTNAHRRMLGWQQYAAAAKHGYYPSKFDYIEQGLKLFDPMYATATHNSDETLGFQNDMNTVKELVDTIIKVMGQSITDEYRGHFHYPQGDGGRQYVTTRYDVILDSPTTGPNGEPTTIGAALPAVEAGYAEFEDADLMRMRLRIIAQRMSQEDMAILTSYIDGEYDSLAAACGDKSAPAFIKRMRNACASLKGSVVFG